MKRGVDKYAKTEGFAGTNDVDTWGEQAGLDVSPDEDLALRDKLEERDEERLDLDEENSPANPDPNPNQVI